MQKHLPDSRLSTGIPQSYKGLRFEKKIQAWLPDSSALPEAPDLLPGYVLRLEMQAVPM